MLTIIIGKNAANVQIMSKTHFTAREIVALELIERATSDLILYRGSDKILDNTIEISDETFGYIAYSYAELYLTSLYGELPDIEDKVTLFINEITKPEFFVSLESLNCTEKNPEELIANKQLCLAKELASKYFDGIISKLFHNLDSLK